jgi:hypothetical protein
MRRPLVCARSSDTVECPTDFDRLRSCFVRSGDNCVDAPSSRPSRSSSAGIYHFTTFGRRTVVAIRLLPPSHSNRINHICLNLCLRSACLPRTAFFSSNQRLQPGKKNSANNIITLGHVQKVQTILSMLRDSRQVRSFPRTRSNDGVVRVTRTHLMRFCNCNGARTFVSICVSVLRVYGEQHSSHRTNAYSQAREIAQTTSSHCVMCEKGKRFRECFAIVD